MSHTQSSEGHSCLFNMKIPQAIRDEIQRTKYSLHGRRKKGRGRGGREKGAKGRGGEGSACSESLCFCITLTNFLVIRLRLLSIKCRYTRQSERKAEPSGYAGIYLICLELTSPLPFSPPFPSP